MSSQRSATEPENKVKLDYMNLLDETNALCQKDQSLEKNLDDINQIMDKAKVLLLNVKTGDELYLDAVVLKTTTKCLADTSHNLDVGEGDFDLVAFAEQFKKKFSKNEEPSWKGFSEVLSESSPLDRYFPSWSPLIGSFDYSVDNKVPQKRKLTRQKDEVAAKKEPEKITGGSNDEDSVDKIVNSIYKKLRKCYNKNGGNPINYFKFVVNPHSFSKTVENIYHVSFLINDGRVIFLRDRHPLIYPVSKENLGTGSQRSKVKHPVIISMDMKLWQGLISALDIKEAMI